MKLFRLEMNFDSIFHKSSCCFTKMDVSMGSVRTKTFITNEGFAEELMIIHHERAFCR